MAFLFRRKSSVRARGNTGGIGDEVPPFGRTTSSSAMEVKYRVTHSFVGTEEGELTVYAGEIVSVLTPPDGNGWVSIAVSRRSQTALQNVRQEGVVPFSFLAEIQSDVPKPAATKKPAPAPPTAPATPAQALAEEHNECIVCCDELTSRPCAVFQTQNLTRSCRHFLHTDCANEVHHRGGATCPICRIPFKHVKEVPNFDLDPRGFFSTVDTDGNGQLSREEVLDCLKALVPMNVRGLEENVEELWEQWDLDGSGELSFEELCDPKAGLLVSVRNRFKKTETHSAGPPPLNERNMRKWFEFWDQDKSGTLDKDEVIRALIKTFRISDTVYKVMELREAVNAVWATFDFDGSGQISLDEFVQPGVGLGESLVANMELLFR